MTSQDRLVSIFRDDIARRRELVRISENAIRLHEDRIADHRAIIAREQAQIERLEVTENYVMRDIRGRRRCSAAKTFREHVNA